MREIHMDRKPHYTSIDEYILSFPRDVQKKLTQLRRLIRQVAPDAEERISYQMPAFFLNGILVWFAAHAKHIGFYPKASGITRFKRELSGYKNAKGSVQFPLDEPLPAELIKRIVAFRVAENGRRKSR
jgi:uncharacterized protein YdhG (YjbR/CyaY superfamily)